MIKLRLNLRNPAMIIAALAVTLMFSSCKEEYVMCVSTEMFETGYGYAEYDALCTAADNDFSCSQLHQSIIYSNGERVFITHVEAERYDSDALCEADKAHYERHGLAGIGGPGGSGFGGGSGGGGGGSAMCNSAYVDPMPEGYVQSNSFCEYVYLYVCQAGYSPSSAEVKDLCKTYRTFQTHDDLNDCRYCQ